MNRKIKFRTWYKPDNKLIYGKSACAFPEFTNSWIDSNRDHYVLQQFIGVEDINGKDIYEGDLVAIILGNDAANILESRGVYEVFHDHFSYGFKLKAHKRNWFDTTIITEEEAKKMTIDDRCPLLPHVVRNIVAHMVVLGNVFENKDLLT
jgi:uncharacterized phage protein (TIGR01671 family)